MTSAGGETTQLRGARDGDVLMRCRMAQHGICSCWHTMAWYSSALPDAAQAGCAASSTSHPPPQHTHTHPTLRLSLCVMSLASGAGPSMASITLLRGCVTLSSLSMRLYSTSWYESRLRAGSSSSRQHVSDTCPTHTSHITPRRVSQRCQAGAHGQADGHSHCVCASGHGAAEVCIAAGKRCLLLQV